jgi:transposase
MKTPLANISEEASFLKERMQREKDVRKKLRLHALYLAKSGKKQTRQEIAEHLGLHRNTVCRWFRKYKSSGIEGMLEIRQFVPPTGQRTLSGEVMESLRERLKDSSGFGSYTEIPLWLEKEHGLRVSYSTLYKILRRDLTAKLKVPRKSHIKKRS